MKAIAMTIMTMVCLASWADMRPTRAQEMLNARNVVHQFISNYTEELKVVKAVESGSHLKERDKILDKLDNAVMRTRTGEVSLTRMGISFRTSTPTTLFKTVKEFKDAKRREMTNLCKNSFVKQEFNRRRFKM